MAQKQQQPTRKHGDIAGSYKLFRQQIAHTVDATGWGAALVLLDVALSVLAVVLFVVSTYLLNEALRYIQLSLACVFFFLWCFHFWLAQDRVRFIFSTATLVDALTIIPEFVLFALAQSSSVAATAQTLPALNFLRVLRILRVVRVFSFNKAMRRHMEGAVTEAASMLGLTLLCILLIAAGLFYELEKYGPSDGSYADLQFHQAIYWAAVTITTVGYGDYAPTYWATQMMLVALLVLTFTLLPYMTSNLMDALTSTSSFERKRFRTRRRAGIRHIVVMGAIDGPTLEGLLNELYHVDRGFNRNHLVVLSEQQPSHAVKHVLYTHDAASKVAFLQGNAFRPQDLSRACVEYADAVVIIAPKHSTDPTAADRCIGMMVLALGQYLQDAHAVMQQQLLHWPQRMRHWLQHNTVHPPHKLPSIFLQVCLPEGRMHLRSALNSLQARNSQQPSDSQAVSGDKPAACAAAPPDSHKTCNTATRQQQPGGQHTSDASSLFATSVSNSTMFWRMFGSSIHVLCLAEIKHAMMSHSVVGVPGTMTLLCNLSTTVDLGPDTHSQMPHLPQWLRDYMVGASQELYQLPCFPATLVGRTVREAAGFIFDSCHAVLLAMEGTKGTNKHRLSVGDLEQVISSSMLGYLIADNAASVDLIAHAQPGDFECWQQQQQSHGMQRQQQQPVGKQGTTPRPPATMYASLAVDDSSAAAGCQQPLPPVSDSRLHSTADQGAPAGTISSGAWQGASSPLGALLHLLHSPAIALRQQGEALLQANYHLRPPDAPQSPEDLVVDCVDLSGHILVLGLPASHESIITLLTALRSKQLLHIQPVVIVSKQLPCGGGSWDVVAQFESVSFIEVSNGLNDALRRASAERAAQAVFMAPLSLRDDLPVDDLTAKVLTDALVIHTYQVLKSLNPHMEVVAELMLSQNLPLLAPTTTLCGMADSSYPHLLSTAYISGSVYHARLMDDMLIANYCSHNASTRIVLELLLSWHMAWARAGTLGAAGHHQVPRSQPSLSRPATAGQQQQQDCGDIEQGFDQQQQQQQQCQFAGRAAPSAASGMSGTRQQLPPQQQQPPATWEPQQVSAQQQQQQSWRKQSCLLPVHAEPPQQHTVPILMQIPVECAPGTTYGRYFHTLLHTRGLLLLGVHRLVEQDGTCFRATITNPSYHSEMQPDDNAFVVARLDLPGDCSDPAAVAAAWPPDTLGFSNLVPMPAQMQSDAQNDSS